MSDERIAQISKRLNDLDLTCEVAADEFARTCEQAAIERRELEDELDELRGFDPGVSETVRKLYG